MKNKKNRIFLFLSYNKVSTYFKYGQSQKCFHEKYISIGEKYCFGVKLDGRILIEYSITSRFKLIKSLK